MKRKSSVSTAEQRLEATYLFDPAAVRSASDPPEDVARLIWMFLSLIRRHEVDYAAYSKEFRRGDKTFMRDIAKLRDLGVKYRFTLTRQRRGKIGLAQLGDMPEREKANAAAANTLQAVADALGEIVANDVSGYIDTSAARLDPFLRVALPRLVAQTLVAQTYRELRGAWSKCARARFRYPSRDRGASEERTVEPHLVTYYDGRYYLVAFDRRPRTNAWRQFALDRIVGPIQLAGTFEYRPVPRHYRGQDSVGLFKSTAAIEISIELSPLIAEAVAGRLWQSGQRVAHAADGSATITFDVHDLGEAVRWAFGFGAQARVVGPPQAVGIARDMVRATLALYGDAASARTDRSESATSQTA